MKFTLLTAAVLLVAAPLFAGTTYIFHNDTQDMLLGQNQPRHFCRSFMTVMVVVPTMIIWNATRPKNTPSPSGRTKCV